jgi:hypothetical protein
MAPQQPSRAAPAPPQTQSAPYDPSKALLGLGMAGIDPTPYEKILAGHKAAMDQAETEKSITDPVMLALYKASPEAYAKVRQSQLETKGVNGGDSLYIPGQGFVSAPKFVGDNGVYGTQTATGYTQTGARGQSIAEAQTAKQDDPNVIGSPAWQRLHSNNNDLARIGIERARLSAETAPVTLTPDTVQQLAEQVVAGAPLPALGMGKAATNARQTILNKVGEIRKAGGIDGYNAAEAASSYKANSGALNQVSRQRNMTESFEATASKNADLALTLAHQGGSGPSAPIFNRPIQAIRAATGDPKAVSFNTALGTFADEYAKVVSGGTGNQGTTDASRKTAEQRINSAMSIPQLEAVVSTMKQEMANRRQSLLDQESGLRTTLSNHPGAKPAVPASSAGWRIVP